MTMFGRILVYLLSACIFSYSLCDEQYFRSNAQVFDKEYSKGDWNFLNQLPIERSRNSLIGVICDHYVPKNGSVLDIGCGEGVLTDYLHRNSKKNYVGIDFSRKAIEIAKEKRPKFNFLHENAESFKPTHLLDAIIFNEMLYYVKHSQVVEHYSGYLSPQGLLIVSNWYLENPKNKYENLANLIYEDVIKLGFVAVDEFHLTGHKKSFLREKVSFRITVFQKKNG